MAASPDLVTVYRSMDATAKDDCENIVEMLNEEGISAVMVDDSSDLDLETVFVAPEMEAMSFKNLMESNGIAAVLLGDSVLPTFPFEVKVAREQAARARKLLEDVESAEPQAARKLSLPLPDVFGFGVTILTSSRTRSGQSLICFGLPLRTTNTIVE